MFVSAHGPATSLCFGFVQVFYPLFCNTRSHKCNPLCVVYLNEQADNKILRLDQLLFCIFSPKNEDQ